MPMRRAPPESNKSSKKSKAKPTQKARVPAGDDDAPEQPPPTIIFCARPRTAAYLTNFLQFLSIRSTALHSHLTQRERLSSLSLFRAAIVPVLISTDVGARGLDIEDVAMVINWDMPKEPEEYIHRVGRTARAGRGGVAISFVTERDEERVLKIETRISEAPFLVVFFLLRLKMLPYTETQLEEMTMVENEVLSRMNRVSTAKRLAKMVSKKSMIRQLLILWSRKCIRRKLESGKR